MSGEAGGGLGVDQRDLSPGAHLKLLLLLAAALGLALYAAMKVFL